MLAPSRGKLTWIEEIYNFTFYLVLVFCQNIFVHLFHLLREGHKAFHRVIEVVVADAHGRVVEQVAELHHRTVLQLRVPGSALQSESVKKRGRFGT